MSHVTRKERMPGVAGREERGINNTRFESKIGCTHYAINPGDAGCFARRLARLPIRGTVRPIKFAICLRVVVSPLVIRGWKTFRPGKVQPPPAHRVPRGNKESKSFSLYATKLTWGPCLSPARPARPPHKYLNLMNFTGRVDSNQDLLEDFVPRESDAARREIVFGERRCSCVRSIGNNWMAGNM